MSPRPRIPDESDDPTRAPFADDAERAETDWLLARDRDPSAPAPSPQLAAGHAELENLLYTLPEGPPDDSWHDAVLKAALAPPPSPAAPAPAWWQRRWLQWSMGGAFATAVAFSAWLLLRRPPPELEVTTRSLVATRSGSKEVAVGDQLVVKARPRGTADLRVFRSNGEMIARFPGGPASRITSSGVLAIEIILDAPGRYQVILVAGLEQPLPVGTMDAYIDAARAAKAHITVREIEAH
jgi:hypothetical protein